MAVIVKKRFWWTPITAPDVVGYRIRTAKDGIPFSKDLAYIQVGTQTAQDGKMEVIAPDAFPSGTFAEETDYQVWISTVDKGGNEADPFLFRTYLDFNPPAAVQEGGISDL